MESKRRVRAVRGPQGSWPLILVSSFPLFLSFFDYFYRQICYMCNLIRNAVALKYPGAESVAVGGFFFLRFLLLVLVNPLRYGITKRMYLPSYIPSHPFFLYLLIYSF